MQNFYRYAIMISYCQTQNYLKIIVLAICLLFKL